jgi:hypothetical protein
MMFSGWWYGGVKLYFPKIALFGMSLGGAFSKGAQDLLNRLAEIKFPTPLTRGSFSYIQPARDGWIGRCEYASGTP